ncbi:phospholipase C [Aquihabitans sp. McL0605]|uniref:phospholipase C n=1 Tax=Aquihabitans sp. McL0605 TaxID=3415671 RepID=UPI003CFB555A
MEHTSSSRSLSRRRFLQLSAAAAATAAVASSCSSGGSGGSAVSTTRAAAKPKAKLTDIDHVVIFFQENRSFDQLYGTRKGVRGYGDADVLTLPNGKPIWYQPATQHPDGYILPFLQTAKGPGGQCSADPDHSWEAQHTAWNGGKMDGYAQTMGQQAMGYLGADDLVWYNALADEFTLADRWHCSVLGPTNPNRHYLMTGTIDPGALGGGPAIDNSGTAYTWETYPERLQRAGISWTVYHQADDFDDNNLKFFKQFHDLPTTSDLYESAMRNREVSEFEADCAAGNLPQVSWIVAPQALSEHPIFAPAAGQAYVYRHLKAIMANPKLWAKTAFIFSYDENGGFFDHVPPPVPDPGTKDEFVNGLPIGMGPRVPGLVVSPWSRGGKVDSHVYDHTSTLRFLEERFGVEAPLISKWRRETAGDLLDAFDFDTFDPSVPKLPDPTAQAAEVTANCFGPQGPSVPEKQTVPVQA